MHTSIIICAYNEEKTVKDVVAGCCELNPECEIIVIDDGSSDSSQDILKELSAKFTFRYERSEKNMGKGWAMARGTEISSGDTILFFDADLANIRKEHFDKLLAPLVNNEADIVLGQPSETVIDYRINPFKPLTGQRALFKSDLLPVLDDIRDIRFGVETFINLYYQAMGKRFKYILLDGLMHPTKYQKTTPFKATKEFIKEGHEIALTLINNDKLIIQRVELQFSKVNTNVNRKINKIQGKINKNI